MAAINSQQNPAVPRDTAQEGAKIGDSLLFLTCGSKLTACAAEK
jgi:hypothetical protein